MASADDFHRAMLAIYDECAALGYRPSEFRRMVLTYKGVHAAKRLINKPETSGLARLAELVPLDLSMERLMIDPRFDELFTADEKAKAHSRLR